MLARVCRTPLTTLNRDGDTDGEVTDFAEEIELVRDEALDVACLVVGRPLGVTGDVLGTRRLDEDEEFRRVRSILLFVVVVLVVVVVLAVFVVDVEPAEEGFGGIDVLFIRGFTGFFAEDSANAF